MNVDDYGWTEVAPQSSSYLNPAVLKILRRTGAQTVLDAGCGNGELAHYLQRSGYQVRAFDADEQGVAIARKKYPDVQFTVGTFASPFDDTFDAIVSTEVVEHLYSPHELGEFCFKSLKPGGKLIISTPYHGYLKNLALSLTDKWDHHHTANWHGGHIKFWSRKSLTQMLENARFRVDEFVGVGRLPYLWKSMILVATRP